jgi:hypothetical protein
MRVRLKALVGCICSQPTPPDDILVWFSWLIKVRGVYGLLPVRCYSVVVGVVGCICSQPTPPDDNLVWFSWLIKVRGVYGLLPAVAMVLC